APEQNIAVTANFTAEPLGTPLQFWMNKLKIAGKVEFAPFNQVFQQLLDPSSLQSRNAGGVNVILARLDYDRTSEESAARSVTELASALRTAQDTGINFFVCLFPRFITIDAHSDFFERMESLLVSGVSQAEGVHVIRLADTLALYPVDEIEDAEALRLGGIPYSQTFFTALATAIARRLYNLRTMPPQVIVLAADNTIWSKEAKTGQVSVGAPNRAMQEFMLAQFSAGRMLCLCGADPEEDVTRTFEQTGGMLLEWEHIAGSRFNSQAVSKNLVALAAELRISLSRFVYVGGNPSECAEVRANCPEIVVLELPSDRQRTESFLRHFWALDLPRPDGGSHAPPADSRLLGEIASEFCTADGVQRAIETPDGGSLPQGAKERLRNPIEETLAGIWVRLLRVRELGIHDNFFQSGGNSLLAVQVIARVRKTLGVELPLRAMFEAPTLAGFAARIESARLTQAGMLAPPLISGPRPAHVPASFVQQRLWFINQLEPDNPMYNIPMMAHMRGVLNVQALHRALNEIVRRHEVLRTTFVAADGQPMQVVGPVQELELRFSDLSALPEKERETQLKNLAQEEAAYPFNLASGLVLRALLLMRAPEDHVLVLVLHHIAGDRWSAGILAEEMEALYRAYARGEPLQLPELPVQYADFALWQRGWLQGEALEKQVGYWKGQLEGAPPLLELPTDRPRPALMSNKGAIKERTLPMELVEKLTAVSQGEGATLFMTLLAGLQILLARYSGQEDIVVGSPIAGRNYTEVEPLIGFFVNTLALRTDVSGNPRFRDLLGRVKQTTLNAYAHQDIPFERLVEELQPERSRSQHPIFQVLLALQNAPQRALELAGLKLERQPLHQGTSAFDLSWFATHVPEGMLLRVEYNTDLFDETTIGRVMGHFQNLLEAIVEDLGRRLSELELLDEGERRRILLEFNDTAVEYPSGLCIHDLVTQQAHQSPDAIALIDRKQRISYRELNARANQIAHYLIKRGAGPDVPIGICGSRTVDLLIAILGILKSGGAYVPLDPNYPRERLGYILEDSGAPLVLTLEQPAGVLPDFPGEAISLDTAWPEIACESDREPTTSVTPRHLGYVLFTSGSTGRPKGVAIEHRSAATFIHWAKQVFPAEDLEGVLLSTSVCFDLSVFEIFVTLSAGGKVIVAENALHLPELTARNEVTLINTVPSAIAELTRMGGIPDSVRTVNLAGEALPGEIVEQIYATTKVENVYNLYGPTEDTTYSTYTLVPRGTPVTIGRPVANTQAYILDRHQKLVPIGVDGELYLAGDGLARGYYGRADLTAERFVHNPFKPETESRMYRTGDLCRWLPNGDIQYLGRLDHQVKLRGFRIELGEIESTLDKHPAVQRSVVVVREDEPGMPRLVAYVVSQAGETLSGETLKQHVRESLPDFMTPSIVVELEEFPLTPNGKINRKELPAPDYAGEHAGAGGDYIAPRTPVERELAEIWSEVLHTERIGADDNFFALGGHSLLAMRVISRIRKAFQVELPVRDLFERPTLAGLAECVESSKRQSLEPGTPLLERFPRNGPAPLSFAQQRLWFIDQLDPGNPVYNIGRVARLRGKLDVGILEQTLNEIVRRHEVLRTSFTSMGGEPVQVVASEWKLALPVTDISHLGERERMLEADRLANAMTLAPYDLATGPLFRPGLLRLSSDDHVFVLSMHHIVMERWSQGVLWKEMGAIYEAFQQQKSSPLPDLPIQYGDYAIWQRNWLRGETLDKHVEYWRQTLSGAPPVLELPTDRPRPAVPSHRGG
ncbi:MAG: amino acid adenylation domain protein, partial [Bryobacterales bacterium]|nr:amino acid adenylation domain protein [Bryobacterales bacterium]